MTHASGHISVVSTLVLTNGAGAIPPSVAMVLPAPINFQVRGSTSIAWNGQLTLTYNSPGVGDFPISSLQFQLYGGSTSLLQASPFQCVSPGSASGSFTGENGAKASPGTGFSLSC